MKHSRVGGRLLPALLAAILLLSAACSSAAPATPTSAPKPAAPTAAAPTAAAQASAPTAAAQPAAPTAVPKPSAAPASTAPIKLATIPSISGANSIIGAAYKAAYELAVEDVNAAGGILGRKVQLVLKDDQTNPDNAVTATKEALYVDNVDAFLSFGSTRAVMAALPLLTQEKKVSMQAAVTTSSLWTDVKANPYAFCNTAIGPDFGKYLADYVVNKLNGKGTKKIAIFADNTAYGKGQLADYEPALAAFGVQPLAIQYYDLKDLDYTSYLKLLQSKGTEAIIFAGYGPPILTMVNNLDAMGWNVPVIGHFALFQADWRGLGPVKAASQVQAATYSHAAVGPDKKAAPTYVQFLDRILAKTGKDAQIDISILILSYDSVWQMKWAMEKAGTTTGPEVAKALESMQDWNGKLFGPYTYGAARHYSMSNQGMTMTKVVPLYDGFFREKVAN